MWSRQSRHSVPMTRSAIAFRTRRPNRRGNGVDAGAPGSLAKIATVDRISIAQQMPWLLAPGRRLDQLLPHPGSSWVSRHVDVHQLAQTVGDEDQHVQRLEREAGHREEVGRPEVVGMVVGLPRSGGEVC